MPKGLRDPGAGRWAWGAEPIPTGTHAVSRQLIPPFPSPRGPFLNPGERGDWIPPETEIPGSPPTPSYRIPQTGQQPGVRDARVLIFSHLEISQKPPAQLARAKMVRNSALLAGQRADGR